MSLLNLDEMLSTSLNTVDAAPEFVRPDDGVYDFAVIKVEAKARKAKDAAKAAEEGKATEWFDLVFTYEITQTVELNDKEKGWPVKPGSLFQLQFQYTEKGLPHFKKHVADLVVANGGVVEDADKLSIKDVMDGFPGNIKFRANARKKEDTLADGKKFEKTSLSNIVAIPA